MNFIVLGGLAGIAICGTAAAFMLFRYHKRHMAHESLLGDLVDSVAQGLLLFDSDEVLARRNVAAEQMIPALREGTILKIDDFIDFMFSCRVSGVKPQKHTAPTDYVFHELVSCAGKALLVQGIQRPDGDFIVLLSDVSDLQRDNQEISGLRRTNFELLQAAQAIPTGIFIADPKLPGNPVVFANGSYCNMAGLPEAQINGCGLDKVIAAQKNIPDAAALEEAVSAAQPVKQEWTVRQGENGVSYQLVLSPVLNQQGCAELFIGMQTDITEIKMQEAQFFQAQKLEALGQLAGGVAHDFNNVLSIIDGYVRMAGKLVPEDGDLLAGYLDRIRQASKRGAGLTKQLLLFGRHKIGGEWVIDLGNLLREHERLLQPLLDSSISIATRAERNLFVECAPDAMAQIIMNLVINSRDAMPEGGNIMIEARKCQPGDMPHGIPLPPHAGGYVLLSVADTGIGMDSKTIARIFDPFYTTKEQGKGTGLGLSTVYGIVQEIHGYIDVHAVPGEGTVMRIYMPLSEKRQAKVIKNNVQSAAGIRFDGFTVLVAEDEPALRELLSSMLEEIGMEVIAAENGAEALQKQDEYEGDIDLLLTDVVMPKLNGVKLAELFLAVREETKVIFMSGFPATGKLARISIPDDAILLAKPVEFEKLVLVMKAVLDDEEADVHNADLQLWQASHA